MDDTQNTLSFPLPDGRVVIARLYGGTGDGWSAMDISVEGPDGQTRTLFGVIHSDHRPGKLRILTFDRAPPARKGDHDNGICG